VTGVLYNTIMNNKSRAALRYVEALIFA
jgi:hypothetical protein